MQGIRNLRNGLTGTDQHHFGTLYPYIFDVGTDGYAHFLLELSGQIIFGVAHLFGKGAELQFLLRVQFDIIPAAADLGGYIGIGPVLPNTENEIFEHGKVQ